MFCVNKEDCSMIRKTQLPKVLFAMPYSVLTRTRHYCQTPRLLMIYNIYLHIIASLLLREVCSLDFAINIYSKSLRLTTCVCGRECDSDKYTLHNSVYLTVMQLRKLRLAVEIGIHIVL